MREFGKQILVGLRTRGSDWWRSRPSHMIAGALLFSFLVCAYVFIELAGEVVEGTPQQFDEWCVQSFRRADDPALPIGPSWLREAGMDATALGSPLVMLIAVTAAVGFLVIQGKRRLALTTVVMTSGGAMLAAVLKYAIGRPRPTVVPHLREVTTPSFPSGHAMLSAIVFLSIGVMLAHTVRKRRTKLYFLLWAAFLTFTVGTSRVYLGVHYPTDVLGGWLAGLAWALAAWAVVAFQPTSARSIQQVVRHARSLENGINGQQDQPRTSVVRQIHHEDKS